MRFSDSGNEFSEENLVDVNLEIIKKENNNGGLLCFVFYFHSNHVSVSG